MTKNLSVGEVRKLAEFAARVEREMLPNDPALVVTGAVGALADSHEAIRARAEDAERESERLRAEVAAAREDTRRLDWLDEGENRESIEQMVGGALCVIDRAGVRHFCDMWREAIDAASTSDTPTPGTQEEQ